MTLSCPRRRGSLIDTAIRPSVRLSVCPSVGYSTLASWRSCPGYRQAGCLQAGRPPEMCELRTRPRTDVDPPQVELPSAGAYRLAAGAKTCSKYSDEFSDKIILQIDHHFGSDTDECILLGCSRIFEYT